MITVLHIAHRFHPDQSGTSERILNAQPCDGVRHILLKPVFGVAPREYNVGEAFRVIEVDVASRGVGRFRVFNQAKKLTSAANRVLRNESIDILYGHNPMSCALAMSHVSKRHPDIPLVYEPHNILYSHYTFRVNNSVPRCFRPLAQVFFSHMVTLERGLFTRAAAVVCQTERVKQSIVDIYRIGPEKLTVAWNGLGKKLLEEEATVTREKYGLPEGAFVLYGGDLSANNGMDKLLKLVSTTRDVFFVVAGDGSYATKLDLAQRSLENLVFLGSMPKEEYRQVLRLSEALLLLREKTLTNDIYLSLKVLDAVALGRKIISAELGIMVDLAAVYPHITFTSLDLKGLRHAVRQIVEDRAKDELPSSSGDKEGFLSECQWNITKARIQELYGRLCVNR